MTPEEISLELQKRQVNIREVSNIDDKVDIYGNTLLATASANGYTDIVKECLDNDPEVDKSLLNGCTALYYALSQEQCECAELLLQKGANPNVIVDGSPLINHVLWDSGIEEIQLLIKYGVFLLNQNIRECALKYSVKEADDYLIQKIAKRRWKIVYCVIKFLSLQQRAVITANHPLRKRNRGEFEESD